MRKLTRLYVLSLIAALIAPCVWSGCDDYDTDVVGTAFSPINSLVSRFVHPVFVEYREGNVRVWGPNAGLVDVERDGARLSLTTDDDSLALIVYGKASVDSLHPLGGQLKVSADRDFALYLSGVRLQSGHGPAVEVQTGDNVCYVVVTGKTNVLSDSVYTTQYADGYIQEADGCLYVSGQLYFDGTGTLTLNNRALPRYDADLGDSVYTHALYARGGVVCNYAMTANLTSFCGDAIHTSGAPVKLVKGTWKLYSERKVIDTEEAELSIGSSATVYINDSILSF